MDDCDSQSLLDFITMSRRLKLPDSKIITCMEEMLTNIHTESRANAAKPPTPQAPAA